MTSRPLADALETLRDDLATAEMPVEEVEHRITLLAEQARGAEPAALASSELLALPERLRAAVSSCLTREEVLGALEAAWPAVEADVRAAVKDEIAERIEAMATEDLSPEPEAQAAGELEWSAVAYLVRQHWPLDETRDSMTIAKRGRFLEELRSLWPASTGELPAGWEAVEAAAWGTVYPPVKPESGAILSPVGLAVERILAAVKPLWPAPFPPAAWQAIEAAMRRELPCICTGSGGPREVHHRTCPARDRAAVLSALRSVELASAARAARLEAALRDLLSDWEVETPKRVRRIVAEHLEEDPQWETIRDTEVQSFRAAAAELRRATAPTLAAPPSDPWAALMALLAELETPDPSIARDRPLDPEISDGERAYIHGRDFGVREERAAIGRRLRSDLGLPPKETP